MNTSELAPLGADAPWVVMKFGGTSVANASNWGNILALARAHRADGARVLVVVSALSGITDALRALCAETGELARAALVDNIVARHRELVAAMQLPGAESMEAHLHSLRTLASDDSPSDAGEALYWRATVQAHGELLSSSLGQAFLSHNGLRTAWVDSRECLHAAPIPNQNARTRALSAIVQPTLDSTLRERMAAAGDVHIAPGFMASDEEGRTVLLGRGGSDTSAACFGALLGAARVEIWTDVTGMFSANPRQVPAARLLNRLDYEEAQEIATTGARVLHPRCLSPLREPRVPLLIKDTAHPHFVGTEIGPQLRETAPSVKAISTRKGITLVSMESVGMWQQVGFLADVFAAFKRHGLSVDLIGSAETNVTVSLDPTENLLDSDAVAALAADLSAVCRVKVIAPCAAVTLVGRGMRSMLHRLSGVLAEFGQVRVHMISQSSNNLNLTFVVDEDVVEDMLPHLHELLIRAGSMRCDDATLFGPSWQQLYGSETAPSTQTFWWREHQQRLLALANERTPRYVYCLPEVRARADALRKLQAVDRWHYAIKANPHPAILAALAERGFGMECVSPGELAAVDAAVPASTPRLFTPNFASRTDFVAALGTSAVISLDGLYPLQHWPDLFAGRAVAVRVDLGRGLGHHEKVRTGGASSKFGLPTSDLGTLLKLARDCGARVTELHAHLGSGILDAGHWGEVYAQLAALAQSIDSVEVLNIGGGLGVPTHPGEAALDLIELDAALLAVKHVYPQYKLWMEPGRYLVADAGVLLARVTQDKHKASQHYLGVNAGMHNLMRPALYDAWHEMVNLSRLDAPADTLYQVVGQICESGDVLGSDRRLPASFEGDVLLIAQAGAYGAVMANHYNLRDAADEVIFDEAG